PVPIAHALSEPDRLWLVGERAFADRLYPLAGRVLERFVDRNLGDRRVPDALLLLGKTRLTLGDTAGALQALGRARTFQPPPGIPAEARFWEAEAFFRLQRYQEARAGFDDVLRTNAAAPFAADALYGYGWIELEMRRPEPAVTAFRDLLKTWPEHRLASSATFYLARALVDLKRYDEALPLLVSFRGKHKDSRLGPDAHYLLGWTRISSGDARGGAVDLKAFVAANPNHALAPPARRLITETLARHGDRDEMAEAYRALIAQTPSSPEALNDAAGIATRLGRATDQETAWRKLRALFPDHPFARRAALELANGAFRDNEWKDAAALARAAAASEEETVRAEGWLLAGEAELKLKRYPAAVAAFDAVGEVPNVDENVRYRALAGLGLAHEELEAWRPALTAYENVASKSPDATLRDWAKERVEAVKDRLAPKPAPASKPGPKPATKPAKKPPAKPASKS
ncbi:MAG: tetratricopeptide repeat protein, partial [Candidatus Rokuibacteriota bacterium]